MQSSYTGQQGAQLWALYLSWQVEMLQVLNQTSNKKY